MDDVDSIFGDLSDCLGRINEYRNVLDLTSNPVLNFPQIESAKECSDKDIEAFLVAVGQYLADLDKHEGIFENIHKELKLILDLVSNLNLNEAVNNLRRQSELYDS